MAETKVNPGIMPVALNLEIELANLTIEEIQHVIDDVKNELFNALASRGIVKGKLEPALALLAGSQTYLSLSVDYPTVKAAIQVSTPPAAFCPLDKDDNMEQYLKYCADGHDIPVPEAKVPVQIELEGMTTGEVSLDPNPGNYEFKKSETVTVKGIIDDQSEGSFKRVVHNGVAKWEAPQGEKIKTIDVGVDNLDEGSNMIEVQCAKDEPTEEED